MPESLNLLPFQRRFVARATAASIDTAVLSIPRGNGKSTLAGYLLERALTPGDELHVSGSEYLLCAASIEQARICFRFVRAALEPRGGYRFLDSATRIGITHVATNTRLRVLSSNAKTSMGIVGCPLLVADEPGSWEVNNGQLLHEAIESAKGKPGSYLRTVYIGTLWPSTMGWWPDLVARGTHGGTYVQQLVGRVARWKHGQEIRRCNPLKARYPKSWQKLIADRNEARRDPRKKALFLSTALNLPSRDERDVLISVPDWLTCCGRAVGEREGDPIIGLDLGGRNSWTAAVALWPATMRVEAFAMVGGMDSIADRERADLVPRGRYQRFVDAGTLVVVPGVRVPPVQRLVDVALERFGEPRCIVADRFKYNALEEVVDWRAPLEPRRLMPSEWNEDIEAVDVAVADKGLNIAPASRPVIAHSLEQAVVRVDTSGCARLIKENPHIQRDDVAVALVLAVGAMARWPDPARLEFG